MAQQERLRAAPDDIEALVASLTLDEKAALLAGGDMWSTLAIDRLGIPSVRVTDGPNGARGPSLTPMFDDDPSLGATCFPSGAALGATWDVALLEKVGALIGDEARRKTCRVLLAPTVNLHRSPLGGRNFESYSEDPLLAGRLGASFVRGAQSAGVVCTVKHFAGNESEADRMFADSIIDERTLREMHLLPFEIAVREGGALGIMTGYNRLNGVYCPDDRWLLDDVLRGEWGFEGFVISDWFAFADTALAIEAGLDLEMPGPGRAYGPALAEAVRTGEATEAAVDAAVARLLGTFDRIGALGESDDRSVAAVHDTGHRLAAREAAAAAMVLLKNDAALPLQTDSVRRLALIGPNADRVVIMGGGSANLPVVDVVSPLEVLRRRLGSQVEVVHEPGVDISLTTPEIGGELLTADGEPGMRIEFFAQHDLGGTPLQTLQSPSGTFTWMGGPPGLKGVTAAWRATADLRVAEPGRWTLSLVQTQPAQLLLNGAVVIDGAVLDPSVGTELFGLARAEMTYDLDLSPDVPLSIEIRSTIDPSAILAGAKIGIRPALPADSITSAVEAARNADTVVVVVGTDEHWESEGEDRRSLHLPGDQDELVRQVLQAAPDAIVVVNTGSPVAMPWAPEARAIVQSWFGGVGMADALADVLFGDTEPGGRLPTTIPHRIEDNPSWGSFPAASGRTMYAEGILVGYRWYQSRGIDVAFPFGHGLSYTRFELGAPDLSSAVFTLGDTLTVDVPVTNVGDRPGSEVVQLYVSAPKADTFRAEQELKAFAKVALGPGESSTVRLELDSRSFARWADPDPALMQLQERRTVSAPWVRPLQGVEERGWQVDPGRYHLRVGRSSVDVAHTVTVDVPRGGLLSDQRTAPRPATNPRST